MDPSDQNSPEREAHVRRDQDQARGRRWPAPDGDRIHGRVEEHRPPRHHEPQPGEAGQEHAVRPQQGNRDDRLGRVLGLDDQKCGKEEHGQDDRRRGDVRRGQAE